MNETTTTGQRPEPKPAADERDALLSVAAHEIRTPLASLRLYLDAVIKAADRGSLDAADVGVRLRKARRQCDRLNVLLNDLIDIARAPARPLAVPPEPVDIVAAVSGVCDRLREQFTSDGWNVEVIGAGPLLGVWDRTRLEQMAANLIASAHKRAPSAPVKVELKPGDGDRVALIVSDSGPGLPPEEQERVFQRPTKESLGAEGIGAVGLWLVARIADAFGGTVRMENPPAGGTKFTIDLPRGQV
ncbi:MAG TPA: HAMP domain-containing sensor histidine kinase [Polyangia bacterium]|jgi:signal transduction histidine kinase|nr:HAMP domain-containing sensor histidine kinase [Polyangia bacterium]